MKTLLCITWFTATATLNFAQDTLTLQNDTQIPVIIVHSDEENIWFKNPSDTSTTIRLSLDRVKSIHGSSFNFEQGALANFKKVDAQNNALPKSDSEIRSIGELHAQTYYHGYKPAATGVLFLSMLGTPVLGLIGVAGTTSEPPAKKSLGLEKNPYTENPVYLDAYTKKAEAIKKQKVWNNFAVGSVVSVTLIVLTVVAINSVNNMSYGL